MTPPPPAPEPFRVLAVFRHPTPYRDGLLDRAAAMPSLRLRVLYLARTFEQTPWEARPLAHEHAFPRGWLPRRVSGHEIAFHPSALRDLVTFRPRACVLSGWSDPTIVAMAFACRILRIPYALVIESHAATGRWTGAPRSFSAWLRRVMVRGAASWLPAGSRAKEHAVSLGADPARCRFFPTAPDARALAEAVDAIREGEPDLRARSGVPESGVIAFIGRLVEDKAPEVLLDALGILAARRPCRLLVAGDGPMRERLERHPAARHATFLGFVQPRDVPRVLAMSDVLALPSRYETWGAVATEALAAGLPVVLSDRVGSAPDILAPPDPPGRIVPCEDAPALAAALESLLAGEGRGAGMRESARRRALEWAHDLNLASLRGALADCGWPLGDAPARSAGPERA